MRNLIWIVTFSFTFLFSIAGFGQDKGIPLNISFFNESTAIPFSQLITIPIHPGIQFGTEFNYQIKKQSRTFQTVNISYFYHNYLAQGMGLNSEFGYERNLKNGIAFSGLIGIGYTHTFSTTEEFTFKDGKYEKKSDKGNARLSPSVSIDIGYYIGKSSGKKSKIFIRYQAWAEYPYSPGFIPVMTHINLHLGYKFFISKKAKGHE